MEMEADRYQPVDAECDWSSPSTTILGLKRFGNGRVGLKVETLLGTWESSSELPPIAEFCEPSVSVSLVSSSDALELSASESESDPELTSSRVREGDCPRRRRTSKTPRPKFWRRGRAETNKVMISRRRQRQDRMGNYTWL